MKLNLALRESVQKDLVKSINAKQANKTATQGGLNKSLGWIGILHSIPVNITRNLLGAKKGITPVDWTDTTTGFTDIFEANNPNLLYNRSFQNSKPYYDLVGSIALDPTTYFTGGATAFGKTAGRIAKMGLRVKTTAKGVPLLNKSGKVIYEVIKTADKTDSVFSKAVKAKQIFTKDLHPKLWDEMNKVKAFDKPLFSPGKSFKERLDQGYTNIFSFGPKETAFNDFTRKSTSKIIDTMSNMKTTFKSTGLYTDIASTKTFKRGNEIISDLLSTRKSRAKQFQEFDEVKKSNTAENYKEINDAYESNKALRNLGINEEEFMNSLIKVKTAQASQKGLSLKEYMKTLDGIDELGQTLKERNAFMNYFQFKGSDDVLTKTGALIGDAVDFSRDQVNFIKKQFGHIEPKFMDEYKPVFDLIDTKYIPENRLQRTKLKARGLDSGVGVKTQNHHVFGFARNLPKVKFAKSNKWLSTAYEGAKGTKQEWRGFGNVSKNEFRKKIHQVITDTTGQFTDSTKKIATLIKNEKLAYAGHTLNDLFKKYDKLDLKSTESLKKLLDTTDSDNLKDAYLSLKETVEHARKVKTKDSINGFKWGDDILNKPLADVFSDIEYNSIDDFYNLGLPYVELQAKVKYEKQIKNLNFMRSIFTEGLDTNISTIVKNGEAIEGFKSLKNMIGAKVPTNQVEELLTKARPDKLLDTKADYFWAIDNELWDILKNDGIFKLVETPTKSFGGKAFDIVHNTFKFLNSHWKQTTLFLFSAYHTRNHVDNVTKTLVEYGGNIAEFTKDYRNTIRILKDNTNLPYGEVLSRTSTASGKGGKVNILGSQAGIASRSIFKGLIPPKDPGKFKLYSGAEISSKEAVEMAYKDGVLGGIITEAGNTSDFLSPIERSLNILKKNPSQINKDKATLLERFIKSIDGLGGHYRDAMESGMQTSEMIEAVSRFQLYKKFLKEMPRSEAIAKVELIMIDYGQMNKFERDFISKVMPFYSFKKGITKYLGTKLKENPLFFQMFREVPEAYEEITQRDEDVNNRAMIPEWLNEGGIQIKVVDGEPIIVSLKGLTSYAEFLNFTKPVKTILESLSPFIKVPTESYRNYSTFFKGPLERYEGETKNALGFEVRKRGLTAGALSSIRAVGYLEQLTESILANEKVKNVIGEKSLFGRKGVKSLFGAGTVGTSKEMTIGEFLIKKQFGIPRTEVDTERVIYGQVKQLQKARRNLNSSISSMKWRYRGDQKSFLKAKDKKVEEFIKTLSKFKAKQLGIKNIDKHYRKTKGLF